VTSSTRTIRLGMPLRGFLVAAMTVALVSYGPAAMAQAPAEPGGASAPDVHPPHVLESFEPRYPASAATEHRGGRVELRVKVGADGLVAATEVVLSAGADLDAAAIEAVRRFRFAPATRNGVATPSWIRVPFVFEPPPDADLAPSAADATTGPTGGAPAPGDTKPAAQRTVDVSVHGAREGSPANRSASDFRIERDVLAAAPRQEGAEVLRSVPGLYLGRGEGGAVAHNYMLRGFDAEHGQDIEFKVGGVPINLPSHLHGQGYADLGFLIADGVQRLRVTEGVHDPRQGDFAVAGSIHVSLGVPEADRGLRLRSSYGSWGTFRQLAMWAPRDAPEESFGAVQYSRTDGFGDNRAGQSGTGILQHRFGEGPVTYRALAILHSARSDLAGVVRRDDVEAGDVCFHCSYAVPSASAQNALANRFISAFFADYAGDDGGAGQLGVWLGYDSLRLQQNFTGFIEESRTLARTAGRGDLVEQQNRTLSFGLTGRYQRAPWTPTDWARGTIELGTDGRLDIVDQAQNLLDASVRNQTWDRRVDSTVRGVDLGTWGDLEWELTRFVRARAGVRADVLSYDVDDRLGNFAPLTRPSDTYIVGYRRSAYGVAWGPRASAELRASRWMSLLGAYGEGFRSPQARILEDGEEAPFTKVRSADLGFRFDFGDPLRLALGGYYTHLSDDVAFDAGEARLERIGATQRRGAVVHAVSRPTDWIIASASCTFVDATLLEPPPATAEEPQPPFEPGQSLPFVPPVVVRADLGARRRLVDDVAGNPLGGKGGLGFSFLSPRPLPYGDAADPFALLDASAGLTWGPAELTLEVFNLFDAEYAAVEYSFPSDWDPNDGVRPRTPARHLSAGAPLSWLMSLGITL
jgi:iron complex outermembrane receptor protein